jgi:putative transposase
LADDGIDVTVACRVLRVSGFYEWKGRPASPRQIANDLLVKHLHDIHDVSRGTYGYRRAHAELVLGVGLPVNRKRVARLMRAAGLQGRHRRRRGAGTTIPSGTEPEADLVQRRFAAKGPDQLWLSDITEHPTREGRLYVAAVMDVFSRRIVGWCMAEHMRTELVLDALGMAITRRDPDGTILHSDHGAQFASWAFGRRLRDAGLLGLMGSVGDCYDNSMMESFWGTLQIELLDTRTWDTREELATAIFEWIECWYNRHRRHSVLGYISPIDYERTHHTPPP